MPSSMSASIPVSPPPGQPSASTPSRALRRRHAKLTETSHLAHRLGTNQFFIDLRAHARRNASTAELRLWWPEHDSMRRFGRRIRPDGHALWRENGTTIGLFLEY